MQSIIELEKIMNDKKNSIFHIFILYSMSCHDNYINLTNTEKEMLLEFIYTVYMKDETKTDLCVFSDIIMKNYKKILNGQIKRESIYRYI